MHAVDPPQAPIGRIRGPDTQGLRAGTSTTVQKSMVHIASMRRSIESAHLEVRRSWNAVLDSKELLDRLRRGGL